ncbi:hypothetical protein [Mesorhizobium sp. M0895]|uniref:hypothetical protein n=1 Tax=Mesorhizobium sp. M0895 TaxID=2957019 RepID=UPI00333BFE6C
MSAALSFKSRLYCLFPRRTLQIGQGLVSATPPQRFMDSAELKGSGLKIEAFIGVEVEHEAVGLFDIRIRFLPSALEA